MPSILYKAKAKERYQSYLNEDSKLPMMFILGAIRAAIEFMSVPVEKIKTRTSYYISGVSFTPAEIAAEIRKHNNKFEIFYAPDFRQKNRR